MGVGLVAPAVSSLHLRRLNVSRRGDVVRPFDYSLEVVYGFFESRIMRVLRLFGGLVVVVVVVVRAEWKARGPGGDRTLLAVQYSMIDGYADM
jgi:hypothetical protein